MEEPIAPLQAPAPPAPPVPLNTPANGPENGPPAAVAVAAAADMELSPNAGIPVTTGARFGRRRMANVCENGDVSSLVCKVNKEKIYIQETTTHTHTQKKVNGGVWPTPGDNSIDIYVVAR